MTARINKCKMTTPRSFGFIKAKVPRQDTHTQMKIMTKSCSFRFLTVTMLLLACTIIPGHGRPAANPQVDTPASNYMDSLYIDNVLALHQDNLAPLQVKFNDKHVFFGTFILPSQALEQPSIEFEAPEPDAHYTFTMIDLDGEPNYVRHWIVTNVDGSNVKDAFHSDDTLHKYTSYDRPKPTMNATNRYVFLAFEQSETSQKFTPPVEELPAIRNGFDFIGFIQTNKLKLVGANYMWSSYEPGYEYIPPTASGKGVSPAGPAAAPSLPPPAKRGSLCWESKC